MFKRFVKDYLTFNRKERFAALIIVPLLLIIAFIPYLLPHTTNVDVNELPLIHTAAEKLAQQEKSKETNDEFSTSYQYERSGEADFRNGELFSFDPNSATAETWHRLGLNQRTIKTILNYRGKGGKFYKPEDLQKIWGMPPGFYDRVKQHINIATAPPQNFNTTNSSRPYEKVERKIAVVDINNSDTAAWAALPGIGYKLSARIVNFQNRLGGFYSVEQVKETYGLPDSTFQKIKPYLHVNAAAVRKINVNMATKDELKVHPYLRWNLANAIVEYRNQHGAFKSLNDLKKIAIIDDATFQKIAPYLTL